MAGYVTFAETHKKLGRGKVVMTRSRVLVVIHSECAICPIYNMTSLGKAMLGPQILRVEMTKDPNPARPAYPN